MSEADGRRTSRDKRKEEMVGAAVTASALPAGASTSALQTANNTLVGAVNESAPGTDTASSGLNGRLQRIAQRITTAIASLVSIDGKLPALTVKNAVPVALGDGAHLDAFSRLRVSMPVTMFESIQRYGDNLLKWETALTGTGSSTFDAAEAGVLMSTGGTASGSSAVRMGRQHIRYLAGKSMLWFHTFRMGTHKEGVQINVGAAMTNGTATVANAVLFRRGSDANGTLYFIIVSDATSTSGTAMLGQSSWNLDTLDGNGPSGITLDTENTTLILVLDLQWLGVGRVRVGFDIGGVIVYAHEFNHANDPAYAGVYMRTASLAPYLAVRNQATLGSALTGTEGTLLHICTSVLSEGADDQFGPTYQFTHSNGITPISVTTRRPVLSIRAKTTGPNSVRNLGLLIPKDLNLTASTNSAFYEVVLNGTLTGASWSSVDATYSLAEKDISATAISGGIVVASGFVISGSGSSRGLSANKQFAKDLALVYSARGNVQDILTIVCTSFTGTSSVTAALVWEEAGI